MGADREAALLGVRCVGEPHHRTQRGLGGPAVVRLAQRLGPGQVGDDRVVPDGAGQDRVGAGVLGGQGQPVDGLLEPLPRGEVGRGPGLGDGAPVRAAGAGGGVQHRGDDPFGLVQVAAADQEADQVGRPAAEVEHVAVPQAELDRPVVRVDRGPRVAGPVQRDGLLAQHRAEPGLLPLRPGRHLGSGEPLDGARQVTGVQQLGALAGQLGEDRRGSGLGETGGRVRSVAYRAASAGSADSTSMTALAIRARPASPSMAATAAAFCAATRAWPTYARSAAARAVSRGSAPSSTSLATRTWLSRSAISAASSSK
ncbi:hypothetical protein [Phytohabitans suffuscus]|uniref:hypothetical protein n=1 Tax=Phytohabitans suffuscus TaxID=624315 RepID=UPI00156697D9|nr:hypothetical protein [Phytohabitans suffuscus]